MKKLIFLVAMVSFVCSSEETPATSDTSIGSVVAIEGSATADGTDGAQRVLVLKSQIFMKDKVKTAENSKMQIMFSDNSLISQGANSELVIDEYVYNPKVKEENKASVGVVKGVFRMVTGKITKLNPEKFETRTKMATIGIRGCDLGFRVDDGKEDIYVIELHGDENVVITGNEDNQGGDGGEGQGNGGGNDGEHEDQGNHFGQFKDRDNEGGGDGNDNGNNGNGGEGGGWEKNVDEGGKAFTVDEDGNLEERDLTDDELGDLIDDVTPDGGLDSGGVDGGDAGTGGDGEEVGDDAGAGDDGTGDGGVEGEEGAAGDMMNTKIRG